MTSLGEEDTRSLCIDKLNNLTDNEDITKEIEDGIYQYVIKHICYEKNLPINWHNSYFKRAYMNKFISLYTNLNPESYIHNINLLPKVLSKEINPYNLAFMTPQEIFPENWKDFIDKKNAKDEFLYTHKLESFTDEYKCGRCKQNKCSYFQAQLLSADESTTTIVTCLNCGNKWKF